MITFVDWSERRTGTRYVLAAHIYNGRGLVRRELAWFGSRSEAYRARDRWNRGGAAKEEVVRELGL